MKTTTRRQQQPCQAKTVDKNKAYPDHLYTPKKLWYDLAEAHKDEVGKIEIVDHTDPSLDLKYVTASYRYSVYIYKK